MLRKKPPIAQKDGISIPQLTEFKSQIVVDVFWEVYVFRHFVHIQVVIYIYDFRIQLERNIHITHGYFLVVDVILRKLKINLNKLAIQHVP